MKFLFVTTVSGTINAFLLPHIQMLLDLGHSVDIACKVSIPIEPKIIENGCIIHEIDFNRSPLSSDNITAYKKIKQLIDEEEYDVIHTHTPIASALVRLSCRKKEQTKVVYTAHGFHFYEGAPLKNWLIYYPLEKWLSKYTDKLITINREDYGRASKHFFSKKTHYVPGVGIDVERIKNVEINKIAKKNEIGIPENALVLLSVGELNKNKNHKVVLKALSRLKDKNIHYVVCGKGDQYENLSKIATDLGIEKQVHLLGHRLDVFKIYQIADIFVFPSFREGLPVSVMEAMASSLPLICSNIRGNEDLIDEGLGGYTFNPKSDEDLYQKILGLYRSKEIRDSYGMYNRKKIMNYGIDSVVEQMKGIYEVNEQ